MRTLVAIERFMFRGACLSLVLLLFYLLLYVQPQQKGLPEVQAGFGDTQKAAAVLGAKQDDPALIAFVRDSLVPPSNLPYNLTNPKKRDFSQFGQSQYLVNEILHNMRGGFFVEAGAVDGEHLSNTLYLERELGWTGLLVEAAPDSYKHLLHKNRKAYSIQAALSVTNVSSQVAFQFSGPAGVLSHVSPNRIGGVTVKAFPLYSILRALNVMVIDFLSLDVESLELKVLSTLPWDKVKIRVMCVEYNNLPEGEAALVSFMQARGYRFLGLKGIDAWFGWPALLDQTMKSQP